MEQQVQSLVHHAISINFDMFLLSEGSIIRYIRLCIWFSRLPKFRIFWNVTYKKRIITIQVYIYSIVKLIGIRRDYANRYLLKSYVYMKKTWGFL